jgi:hypothetical protein
MLHDVLRDARTAAVLRGFAPQDNAQPANILRRHQRTELFRQPDLDSGLPSRSAEAKGRSQGEK